MIHDIVHELLLRGRLVTEHPRGLGTSVVDATDFRTKTVESTCKEIVYIFLLLTSFVSAIEFMIFI